MRLAVNHFEVIMTILHREKKPVGASPQCVMQRSCPLHAKVLSVDFPCYLALSKGGTILLFVLVLIVQEADLKTKSACLFNFK